MRVQGYFAEIRAASGKVSAHDDELNASVGDVPGRAAQMAVVTATLGRTNAAMSTAVQAAMAAVDELSARMKHQAKELADEATELETLDGDHAGQAQTLADSVTWRTT